MPPYKRLAALCVGVLAGMMLVLLSWLPQPEPNPEELEVSPLTFQEVVGILEEDSKLTTLERDKWLEDLEGKQVYWDGWVSSAQDALPDTVKVVLWSLPVVLTEDKGLDVPKGAHFAILSFAAWHKPSLIKLKVGQEILVRCIFEGHVGATTVSLEECALEGIRYESHPDDEVA